MDQHFSSLEDEEPRPTRQCHCNVFLYLCFCLLTQVVLLEPYNVAMTRDCWQLSSPVGYSYQTMDQLLFSSLKWDSGRLGLRVDNLPIEVSHSNYHDKGNGQNCYQ